MKKESAYTIAVIAASAIQGIPAGLQSQGIAKVENWEVAAGLLTASLDGLVGDITQYRPKSDGVNKLAVLRAASEGPAGLANLVVDIISCLNGLCSDEKPVVSAAEASLN